MESEINGRWAAMATDGRQITATVIKHNVIKSRPDELLIDGTTKACDIGEPNAKSKLLVVTLEQFAQLTKPSQRLQLREHVATGQLEQ